MAQAYLLRADDLSSLTQYRRSGRGQRRSIGSTRWLRSGGIEGRRVGNVFHIALPGPSQVAGYTINATTGKLVKILGSPWNTIVPAAGPVSVHGITP